MGGSQLSNIHGNQSNVHGNQPPNVQGNQPSIYGNPICTTISHPMYNNGQGNDIVLQLNFDLFIQCLALHTPDPNPMHVIFVEKG
jgi:hypothetical protein